MVRHMSQLELKLERKKEADRNLHLGGRSFYFFDFDDNVAFLATPILLFHKENQTEIKITSGQWAQEHSRVGKSGPFADYDVIFDDRIGSFRHFRDHDYQSLTRLGMGRQIFIEDIAEALGFPDFQHWPQKLVNESFNIKEKSIYIIEGLMMYLEESQAHGFMHCLSQFAKKDDIIVMDIFNKFLLKSPHMQMQLDFLKSIGAPWLFGVDDVSEFFSNYDWTAKATQPGQYNPNRWPFPVAPDFVKEVPRSYYVVAKKNK